MRNVYRVYYRRSIQSIYTRPLWRDIIAPDEKEARKKFRAYEPNADIVEIRQL